MKPADDMNLELFERIAQWLEAGGDDCEKEKICFYMPTFVVDADEVCSDTSCETACCIAGAAIVMAGKREEWDRGVLSSVGLATNILRIPLSDASQMFTPDTDDDWFRINQRLTSVTPAIAAHVVRHYMTTQKVDWRRAFEAEGVSVE